jgi:hypothetical protein
MKRQKLIWGLILLLVGVLLLADNLGLFADLPVGIWQIIWPVALIALGIWVLWATTRGKTYSGEEEHRVVPVEGSKRAEIALDYGAGEFSVESGTEPGAILSGDFEGGVETRIRREGGTANVRLSNPSRAFWLPWTWSASFRHRWSVRLTDQLPLDLTVKVGASDCRLDLTECRVERLRLDTGASSTRVQLPARAGHTEVTGSSGAASVSVKVPEGVAARIRASGGVASINVDRKRFPRQGQVYVSPDYETAENTVDIDLDMGVGSLSIS